nr:MAG TPA_asm: hypothetical protein [Caudoviricetes sp.]
MQLGETSLLYYTVYCNALLFVPTFLYNHFMKVYDELICLLFFTALDS